MATRKTLLAVTAIPIFTLAACNGEQDDSSPSAASSSPASVKPTATEPSQETTQYKSPSPEMESRMSEMTAPSDEENDHKIQTKCTLGITDKLPQDMTRIELNYPPFTISHEGASRVYTTSGPFRYQLGDRGWKDANFVCSVTAQNGKIINDTATVT